MHYRDTTPGISNALSSWLGGLGLSPEPPSCAPWTQVGEVRDHDDNVTEAMPLIIQDPVLAAGDSREPRTEERLTPRAERLTEEITKLRLQIKRLTRRRKVLDARSTNSKGTQGSHVVWKISDYFPRDERRRRMLSAEPPKRTATTTPKRIRATTAFVSSTSTGPRSPRNPCVGWRCRVDTASTDAQKTDKRLSVSFLLS